MLAFEFTGEKVFRNKDKLSWICLSSIEITFLEKVFLAAR
jgi:hypothetical protein